MRAFLRVKTSDSCVERTNCTCRSLPLLFLSPMRQLLGLLQDLSKRQSSHVSISYDGKTIGFGVSSMAYNTEVFFFFLYFEVVR